MPLISIIVPVYNTEKYLHACIASILMQSYTDFELLLIDDGSTDSSGAICDKYAQQDNRIRVFHQKNRGVTLARQLGIENAHGQFISFVDSDDELYVEALRVLYENIDSDDVNIVCSDIQCEAQIGGEEYVKMTLCGELYNKIWGNLYRRSLFTNWVMDINPEINIGEDALMNLRIGLTMKQGYAKCIRERIYMYRQNPQSVTNTRRLSLEYEELYILELKRTLSNRIEDFLPEYYSSILYTLENLIVSSVLVDYNRTWVIELKQWYQGRPLRLRHRILLRVSHNLLCKYLLAIEKRIKTLLKNV